MPGPARTPHPPGETAALVTQVVDELARRLALDGLHPTGEPVEAAVEARRRALTRLGVLRRVRQAVRQLEDQAAHVTAESGAGHPEIGQAVGMSRQGARRRRPGLTSNRITPPTPHPELRSS
ncbi:hypothetical protein NX794_17740 [Streptomyces sp. LP11]|uniref:Uncharacterized protein n=1 Tax=Streptomyces pyxinicus TaxID=2970331 RepID=A0ABT2B3D6_9ACTN|nr:hypothetical protein [Streptomyces sp. LP11]MCS0603040.1 hypothetical protein [Streptomyces sp. LP11]